MKILAFGEVMMRLMPSNYKKLQQVDSLEYLFTGTGVNVLSGLHQMGEEVYLTTVLPNNAVGKAACSKLQMLGINDSFIQYKGDHIGIYILETGFGKRASQVTYLNRKDSSFGLSTITDYNFSCLEEMDALCICGISLAISKNLREVTLQFIREAKKRNIKVIFDCNFRSSLWNEEDRHNVKDIYQEVLYQADIVFAGYKDATLLLEMEVDSSLTIKEQTISLLQQMCKKYTIDTVFGTTRFHEEKQYLQGYQITKDSATFSKKHVLDIYDRVGGGDGFASGAIYGYLHKLPKQELVEYATMSGVLAHTTYGDSPIVSKEEILEAMLENNDIKR